MKNCWFFYANGSLALANKENRYSPAQKGILCFVRWVHVYCIECARTIHHMFFSAVVGGAQYALPQGEEKKARLPGGD